MAVAGILLVATVATQILLAIIAYKTFELAKVIRTKFARQQALVIVLLCIAGIVGTVQDIGIHAIRLDWLPLDTGGRLVSGIQAILVVGTLAFLVPTLVVLKQLTAEFARTEIIADNFVDRLPKGVTTSTAGLTRREIEVVDLIGSGVLSDKELAEELTVSPATAATHIRNIMRKTGIKRRADLALLALQAEAKPDS
ncbi:MAG: response regulator transcription factor [Acidimicrobiales bacterium]